MFFLSPLSLSAESLTLWRHSRNTSRCVMRSLRCSMDSTIAAGAAASAANAALTRATRCSSMCARTPRRSHIVATCARNPFHVPKISRFTFVRIRARSHTNATLRAARRRIQILRIASSTHALTPWRNRTCARCPAATSGTQIPRHCAST